MGIKTKYMTKELDSFRVLAKDAIGYFVGREKAVSEGLLELSGQLRMEAEALTHLYDEMHNFGEYVKKRIETLNKQLDAIALVS